VRVGKEFSSLTPAAGAAMGTNKKNKLQNAKRNQI
jgi:hypothetical protein